MSSPAPIRWFYLRDRQQVGPVPFAELASLARQGVLRPDDLLLPEGENQ